MSRRLAALAAFLALPLLLSACAAREDTAIEATPFAEADTALEYEAAVEDAPTEEAADLIRQSLRIFRREEDGANSVPLLRRRAESDVETARKILRSFGWFEAEAEVEVTAPTPEEIAAAAAAHAAWDASRRDAAPATGRDAAAEAQQDAPPEKPKARAIIRLIPGPRYTLAAHRLVLIDGGAAGLPDPLSAESLGAPVGAPAEARGILAAESAALRRLKAEGRPWAARRSRRAVADFEAKTLEVETVIATGPAAVYGEATLSGAPSVEEAYLRSWQEFEPGAATNPEDLKDFQKALAATDLFDSVSVRLPETPPATPELTADGAVRAPVTVEMEEGPPRTVAAGLRFSQSAGPEVKLGYTHRNLFGAGERFDAVLAAGLPEQRLDLELLKPQFLRPGQALNLTAGLFSEETDAYDSQGLELGGALSRALTDQVTVGAGGLFEFARTAQNGPRQAVRLLGAPLFARYDGADDRLDPKEGLRAAIAFTPFLASVDSNVAPFFEIDGSVSAYMPLDEKKDYVLAGRVRLASILSDDLSDVPANRRLFSGGGGSVRGFGADMIGPLDDDYDPTGGRSALELGAEIRGPLYGAIGGALFVEAGMVGEDPFLTGEEDILVAAGAGLRFASPAGPLRLDVAVPLNARENVDDFMQIYISIGQAW